MKKGTTNNPNGRPKGIPNKLTTNVKEVISSILAKYTNESEENNFYDDFKNLDGNDRVKVALKMMEFVVPKLQRTTIEDNTTRKREIDDVIAKLTQ